jgi:hypothetical protein
LVLIPGTDNATIEGCIVFEELTAACALGYNTIVDIVSAIAFGTMQLKTVVLPGQGIVVTPIIREAVGALSIPRE